MSRVTRLVPALVALSLVAAACGSDAASSDTTAAAATTEAVETTAAAATTEAVETTVAEPAATEPAATEPAATEPMSTEAMTTMDTTADTTAETTADTEPADTTPETTAAPLGGIVDVATAAGNFTILLAAVEAAGLTEDLNTTKLTLLAPTDDAFNALGQATIDAVLADPAALTALLQNHLLPNAQDAHQLGIFQSVVTVAGNQLAVAKVGDVLTIGGATVTTADVAADNGFIHVIDTVLVPAPAA